MTNALAVIVVVVVLAGVAVILWLVVRLVHILRPQSGSVVPGDLKIEFKGIIKRSGPQAEQKRLKSVDKPEKRSSLRENNK